MGLIVDAGEVLEIKVGVDLGCRDVGVAEQLLHPAQVLARFEQMGGERVPKQVRVNMQGYPLKPRPACNPGLDGAWTESTTVSSDEQRRLTGGGERLPLAEPVLQGFEGFATHGHDAHLATLAGDAHGLIPCIERLEIECDEFGKTQPGGIQQFHDGPIAHGESVV